MMPRYRVVVSRRADKFLSELKGELRSGVLEDFPFFILPHDLAKLKGKEGYYRLRIGGIRIIFKVDKVRRTVYVEKISYRERAYE